MSGRGLEVSGGGLEVSGGGLEVSGGSIASRWCLLRGANHANPCEHFECRARAHRAPPPLPTSHRRGRHHEAPLDSLEPTTRECTRK